MFRSAKRDTTAAKTFLEKTTPLYSDSHSEEKKDDFSESDIANNEEKPNTTMTPMSPSRKSKETLESFQDVELASAVVKNSGDTNAHHRYSHHTESSHHDVNAPVGGGGGANTVSGRPKTNGDSHPSSDSSSIRDRWNKFISSAANMKSVSACLLYSTCSVSMVLSNKCLASSFHPKDSEQIDINILIVIFQAIIAVGCVEGCKHIGNWVEYPSFNLDTAKQWAPVNIFFCAMLFTGMASLQHNSVPMVTIFKNLANIVTATGDYYFYGNPTNTLIIVSFSITLSGAVFAAWHDISITGMGLFWMTMNCLSTSGYVLYLKYATNHVKLSKFGMVYYNNLLCLIFLLPVAYYNNQLHKFATHNQFHSVKYMLATAFAGCMGFFLNFASLHCVSTTGPTTYAVVGSLNKIPVAVLGYFIFDSYITSETWFFIWVSLCGGFLYSYAKILQSKQSTK